MLIQPFNIVECLSSMKYSAWFVSSSKKECDKALEDRKRYETYIEIDPWGKVVDCGCECDGFRFKKRCKHITELLNVLKEWGEISEIPEF